MPSGLAKDVRRILDVVEDNGFIVVRGSKHFKVMGRDGKGVLASVSTTPSDNRALDNLVSKLRTSGVLTVDPRKEGQMAAVAEMSLSPEQEQLRTIVVEVLAQGISQMELARHTYELSLKQNEVRHFGSRDAKKAVVAALWHVRQLLQQHTIAKWAAVHIEAAAKDILAVPIVKAKKEAVVAADMPAEGVARDVYLIARAIQDGLDIEYRRSKKWGHGLWHLMGVLAVESADRHGLDLRLQLQGGPSSTKPVDAAGVRIRAMIEGNKSWDSTVAVVKAMVQDWNDGYRLRQEMFKGMIAIPDDKVIPSQLLSTAFDTPPTVIQAEPEGIPASQIVTPEEPGVSVLGDEKPWYAEPPAEKPKRDWHRVSTPEFSPPRVSAVPEGWANGELPLHLEMILNVLPLWMNEERANALIATAQKVLLTEIGSHQ